MVARQQQQQRQVVAPGGRLVVLAVVVVVVSSAAVVGVDAFAPPLTITATTTTATGFCSRRRSPPSSATGGASSAAPRRPLRSSSNQDQGGGSEAGGGGYDELDDWFADFNPAEFDDQVDEAADAYSPSSSSSFGGGGGGRGRGGGGGGGGRGRGRPYGGRGGGSNNNAAAAGYERDTSRDNSNVDVAAVETLIADRARARQTGDFDRADALRDALLRDFGVKVWDRDRVWRSGCSSSGSGGGPRWSSTGGGGRGGGRGGGGRGGGGQRGGGRGSRGPPRPDFGPKGHDYRMAPDAGPPLGGLDEDMIHELIAERLQCKLSRNFVEADAIQNELEDMGVFVDDASREWRADGAATADQGRRFARNFGPTGHDYSMAPDAGPIPADITEEEINQLIADRLQCKLSRNYREADRIQEELRSLGVWVHDGRKEWRADGQGFGDYSVNGGAKPGRDRNSRSDRNRPYEQSEHSAGDDLSDEQLEEIESLVARRSGAKLAREYDLADELRAQLISDHSVFIDDRLRQWSVGGDFLGGAANAARDRPFVRRGGGDLTQDEEAEIADLVQQRADAKKRRDYDTADSIRDMLDSRFSVRVDDRSREWRVMSDDYAMSRESSGSSELDDETIGYIQNRLKERSEYKKNRDYDAADEIRDELRTEYSVSIDDRTREWSLKVSEYTVVESNYDARRFRNPSPYSEMQEDDDEDDDDVVEDDDHDVVEDDDDYTVEPSSDEISEESDASDLSKLTVVQLKDRLREAGLPVSGKKSELIERLSLAE